MPTQIELDYEAQGYRLPVALTWSDVERERKRWRIDAIFVPLAFAPGCAAWGVPYIEGRPLRRADCAAAPRR